VTPSPIIGVWAVFSIRSITENLSPAVTTRSITYGSEGVAVSEENSSAGSAPKNIELCIPRSSPDGILLPSTAGYSTRILTRGAEVVICQDGKTAPEIRVGCPRRPEQPPENHGLITCAHFVTAGPGHRDRFEVRGKFWVYEAVPRR
jgi:hypothetical protein